MHYILIMYALNTIDKINICLQRIIQQGLTTNWHITDECVLITFYIFLVHFLKHCCHKLSVPPSVFLPIYHPKMVMHAFRMSARRPISKMVYSVYGQRTNHGKKMCESGDKISNQLMYKNALNIHCKCTFSRTHTFDFTLSRLLIWVNFCWQMSHMRQVLSLSDSSKCCLSWSSLLKRSVHCPTVSLQVCTSVNINNSSIPMYNMSVLLQTSGSCETYVA